MPCPADYIPCPNVHAFTQREAAEEYAKLEYGKSLGYLGKTKGVTKAIVDEPGRVACFVIVEGDDMSLRQKLSLLVHECVHVAKMWTEGMGEDDPGEEFLAYAVQGAFLACMHDLGEEWLS